MKLEAKRTGKGDFAKSTEFYETSLIGCKGLKSKQKMKLFVAQIYSPLAAALTMQLFCNKQIVDEIKLFEIYFLGDATR